MSSGRRMRARKRGAAQEWQDETEEPKRRAEEGSYGWFREGEG